MNKEIFHVHTYRCGHAGNEADKEYVEKAIHLGAAKIYFTDHAPFPGNPFGNRMDMEQLPEYISTLSQLKQQYGKYISVIIGLEIEYLPSQMEYYRQLKEIPELQLLMLGQHFFEHEPGHYSFSDGAEELKRTEAAGIGAAIVDGINTGLFQVVAHPDRTFRRRKIWTPDMEQIAKEIISAAIGNNVILEQNESSMRRKHQYWQEFWQMVPDTARIIKGLDAHFLTELK